MKYTGLTAIAALSLVVILLSGCISTPEKGTTNETKTTQIKITESLAKENDSQANASGARFVQINLWDGTSVGGKYVSETPAFTTIELIYTLNPNALPSERKFVKGDEKTIGIKNDYISKIIGDGKTIGIKNDYISKIIDIEDPTPMIEAAQPGPVRNITFDTGEGIRTVSKVGNDYYLFRESQGQYARLGKETYWTKVNTSQAGYVNQDTMVSLFNEDESSMGFIDVAIKTIIDESLKPLNKTKVIQDEVKKEKGANKEIGTYEATLANGDKVAVHSIKFPTTSNFYDYRADVFSYMPDNNTIVTVVSSTDKQRTSNLIKTLTIGEFPPPA